MVARSTAGCYTCERRKKKCDEAQPYCSRCIRSGRECEGYAPLESPDSRGIMRSGKPKDNRIAKVPSQSHTANTLTLEGASQSNSSASPGTSDQYSNTDLLAPPVGRLSQPSDMDDVAFFPPLETIWYPDTIIRGPTLGELPAGSPFQGSHASSLFFEGRNLLGYHQTTPSGLPSYESTSPQIKDGDLEDDPEGTRQEMCTVPVPDPNTPDNALPFVLQSYARWITLVAFESSKAIYSLKELIVNKFMHSPGERSKIILLSNVIGSLGKTIELGSMGTSLITYLRTEAHDNISKFIAKPPAGQREVDMKNASEALDLMMEVILTQRYSSSTLSLMRLMEAAAPVFRRACPEPMDQYVNLPRAILSPTINVRHFALTDILISTATGRPMLFRYDVEYPSDILEKMKEGIHGMEWLHGIPDQYIVLLARINVLSEEYGANVSSQCVAKIENWIHEVEIVTKHSADPVATIRRFTVRECWKLTMQIYLYMFLGRASAADPRVLKMVKSFIRLMEAVSPGRNPDSFLYVPMIIVGASAYRYQDRAVIRQRMLGLQECVKQGSCGHDALHMLIDLWTRTEAEDRPAVWDDLRFSALRVLGV